jgi:tetratricopeptide (TPR) repeat protein
VLASLLVSLRLAVLGLLFWLVPAARVLAGGGPETTLVVVNADSIESREIANYYVALRGIPSSNLVWLEGVPSSPKTDIKSFRERIWKPIHAYLKEQELDDQIDVIAYSAGFPYGVDFSADLRVELGGTGYLARNRYARRDLMARTYAPRPPSKVEESLYERARKLVARRKYEEAVAALTELSESYPWNPRVWYDLAVSQSVLKRDPEALRSLEKAVDAGWSHSLTARSEGRFGRLRDTPRFRELVERMQRQLVVFQPAHGFRGRYVWDGGVRPVQDGPRVSLDRYFLSVMLGYTGFQGNSVEEVLRYLRRAAASDGTHPEGTVYLMENRDVRAQTRERYFHATAQALRALGRRVEIVRRGKGQDGIVPRDKPDVIGAVVGAHDFDWKRSGSRFLPGAIAESLTSYGGDFERRKQTKLSAFLRYGAAGSSGTVAEPYALQAKFPVSNMHVDYAAGSSLAEAFYQSVELPYQLLVVGDPLARPFATFARVSLASPDPGRLWKGTVRLKPKVVAKAGHATKRLELWVDGHLVDTAAPGKAFLWDTRSVDDGYHELRIVAVDADPIETRSYAKVAVNLANTGYWVTASAEPGGVAYEQNIVLEGAAPGATEVRVVRGARELGSARVDRGRWKLSLPASAVGPGQVELIARARFADERYCRSIEPTVTSETGSAPMTLRNRPCLCR